MADDTATDDNALLSDQALGKKLLREIALGAVTREWGYCPNCRKKVQTDVDDAPARVNAAKALLGKETETTVDTSLDPATLTPTQRAALFIKTDTTIKQQQQQNTQNQPGHNHQN